MDFSKLRASGRTGPASLETLAADAHVSGIVKVRAEGYAPEGVKVRTRVSSHILTADFMAGDLAAIRRDPLVESVSVSEPLPLQKLPKTD